MSATDVLSAACDRLVGGMMFHADHADLCRLTGVEWLARLHDRGFVHDAKAHARVRRVAMPLTGMVVPGGRQDRTHTLDKWHGVRMREVAREQRETAVRDATADWLEWEESAAATYCQAHKRMLECGQMTLAELMASLATDAESEIAEARRILTEIDACGCDMSHVLEMRG